jgi:urea carboxylase-associated protein 2
VTAAPAPDGSGDGSATATLEAARAHARSQAGGATTSGATIPARAATDLPDGVAPDAVVWDETIGVGGYAHRLLPRDTLVRFSDPDGDACLHVVAWNAARPTERLNVADTVKVQWQAYLGSGALLLSDLGRVLLSIVADTGGRHDALCGGSSRRRNEERYGAGAVGSATPCARDLMVVGAARYGLGRRDVPAGVNLFKGARVGPDGALRFQGERRPGAWVELRAELDVLVVVANVPHPLDPRVGYEGSTARATAWTAPRPADDPLRTSSPERHRAFENTEDHLLEARP